LVKLIKHFSSSFRLQSWL